MAYSIGNYRFHLEEFFPVAIKDMITELRVSHPHIVHSEAQERKRRASLAPHGKLTILAADHPARRVTSSGDDPIIMGDRVEYLGRILRVLTAREVDGVMGPTDIIEERIMVNHLVRKKGGPIFLYEQ